MCHSFMTVTVFLLLVMPKNYLGDVQKKSDKSGENERRGRGEREKNQTKNLETSALYQLVPRIVIISQVLNMAFFF